MDVVAAYVRYDTRRDGERDEGRVIAVGYSGCF